MANDTKVITLTKEGGLVTVTVRGFAPMVVDVGAMLTHEEEGTGSLAHLFILQAAMHGIGQKLVDAAALSRNPDTGAAASIADKHDAVRKVYDRLMSGEWNAERGTNEGGFLYRAMKVLRPDSATLASQESFGEWLDGAAKKKGVSRKTLEASLRARPDVAEIIDGFRTKSAIDTDDILAEVE